MDCDKQGIRLHFNDIEINKSLRNHCIKYCRWLRKKYIFPIRCNIHFEYHPYYRDSGKKSGNSNAIFYYQKSDNLSNVSRYPKIRIAVSEFEKLVKTFPEDNILFHYLHLISHELTHYFQWYFFENDERTKRSLEIEANRWADYLTRTYMNQVYYKEIQCNIDYGDGVN